jgi:hypothetical protein
VKLGHMRESIKTTEPLELESTDPELHQKDTILIHNNGFSTTIKFKTKLIWGFGPMYFFCWIQTIIHYTSVKLTHTIRRKIIKL